MTLVYILGIDGAGKTTVAQRLATAGLPGGRVRRVYCQHRPLLLNMAKWVARACLLRGTTPSGNYETYRARKVASARRYPRLATNYARLWCLDAALQAWPRILWARAMADVVLADRYYLDWVINVGLLRQDSVESMLRRARRFERFLPKAQIHLFLDVADEVAFARKRDIPSVEYLRERRELYLQLAPHYEFHRVDANQNLDSVLGEARALLDTAGAPAGRTPRRAASKTR